jgi:hypothetical protein
VTDLSAYVVVVPAVLTGIASWAAARWTAHSNEKIAGIKRDDEIRVRTAADRLIAADDLTHRFKVLMDSYEARIRDLTTEVRDLRVEVSELRLELAERERRHNHDGTD